MASVTPYTFIKCPCSDPVNLSRHSHYHSTNGSPTSSFQSELDDDGYAFNPRSPRAGFSLYPLEYLLYCEDCHQIRCPKCIAEEVVTYYCPNCLFEVPGSNIKTDGNRCTRSCFQCPVCIGPLSVTAIDAPPLSTDPTSTTSSSAVPSYILTCSYCQWTSAEIGIKFDKPNGIYAQLQKIRNGGKTRLTMRDRKEWRQVDMASTASASAGSGLASPGFASTGEELFAKGPEPKPEHHDVESHFASLKAFYQSQLADTTATGAGPFSSLGDLGISSPGSLSRIMSLYTGTSLLGDNKAKSRTRMMREALEPQEGLEVADLDETGSIDRLHRTGWDETVSTDQAAEQLPRNICESTSFHGRSRFVDELRPIPFLLRTKRSKRCPVCRHIVSKPEAKVSNTRFRIRLVAGSYLPSISMKPLQATSLSQTISGAPFGSTSAAPGSMTACLLAPLRPVQYLLTFKNPIFGAVKVTLATPAATPGRFASRVTILCPEFEIDANTDVWDEALKESSGGSGAEDRHRHRVAKTTTPAAAAQQQQQQPHQAEPGKVWERGRNWVTIVVEVVPASLRLDENNETLSSAKSPQGAPDLRPLREDEDVLEIPMFVRLEWEAEDAAHDANKAEHGESLPKREVAYWCALGVGRISQE